MNDAAWVYSYVKQAGVIVALLAFSFGGDHSAESAESVPARQPLVAQVRRIVDALEVVGAPLSDAEKEAIEKATTLESDAEAIQQIQKVLDRLCLAVVTISPESRVKAQPGDAPRELVQHGWRPFLIKVNNKAGVTAPLGVSSPQAKRLHDSDNDAEPPNPISRQDVVDRWLDIEVYVKRPLAERLSGLPIEYRIIELYSRDAGQREAVLQFDVGQGTQDLGFRNETAILFDCQGSVEVELEVVDADGKPTTGQFTFRDKRGRIYPARSRRLAPDFFFHDQIYREDGETVLLPPGTFEVTYTRGPEYRIRQRTIEVPDQKKYRETFELERWINLADRGWFSGDHHVHAAGCAHYSSPTQGVEPIDMLRHVRGEDLNVGCILTWGPCWYYQKQFFDGKVHPLSAPRHLMRYDVEVSGFPSSHAGHLVLLRLKEDDYPGTTRIEEWPSWDLPILKWGKSQGGVVGFAHSGWGLAVSAESLPTYEIPPYDGIGANEYVVDVTHDACDFISTVDTPSVWELNVWYHTLNCGYTARISGETDFPCIYGERVGLGRSYVKLDPDGPVDFDAWVQGVKQGRSYVSEGLTHLFDFQVNGLGVGEPGHNDEASRLAVAEGDSLTISVQAAALLDEEPNEDIRDEDLDHKPYWHVERARHADSRQVPVELIVNGIAVDEQLIDADGKIQEVRFDYVPERSSWVALRVFPAAHTNPVFVEVDGKPIRASRKSAQWCLESVDRCWESKEPQIREEERAAAKAAYDHAREAYRQILAESYDDGQLNDGDEQDD